MTDHPTDGELAREIDGIVGKAWKRNSLWPKDDGPLAGLEWAKAVLKREEADLNAAAIPTKSDCYVICGDHAAAVRDAHKIVLAALRTPEQPANTDHTDAALADERLRDHLNSLPERLHAALARPGVTVRVIEAETGVSKATVSRASHGEEITANSFVALHDWLSALTECNVPPPGWRCTRRAGHEGPCAALPATVNAEQPEGVERLRPFLRHLPNCLLYKNAEKHRCSCGHDAALAAANPTAEQPAEPQPSVVERLWLWRNGEHEFVAYRNPFPCQDGGDPLTLGEPAGWAYLHPSSNGRPDYPVEQVERDIARAALASSRSSETELLREVADAADDMIAALNEHIMTPERYNAAGQRLQKARDRIDATLTNGDG